MNGENERRKDRELHNGLSDGFEPLAPLDLRKCTTISELVAAMGKTSFTARGVGEAADLLYDMTADRDMMVVGTFSGAMTAAKMGLVLCDMIDYGMIKAIVSTGALMAHGFVEAAGMTHFKYRESMGDKELYEKGYDRIYDTLELEKNLDDAEVIMATVLDSFAPGQNLCSYRICRELGKYLHEHVPGRGILKSAYEKKVPIYIPAWTDSELGLDFGIYRRRMRLKGKSPLVFNPYLDLEHYTSKFMRAKKVGIFTIGGGAPRNWAQQVGPYLDIIQKRIGKGGGFKRFDSGIRICPEPVHWGGLSGCTYSEGISWGKFTPPQEGGRFVEVISEATIAWPLVTKAVMERLDADRKNGKQHPNPISPQQHHDHAAAANEQAPQPAKPAEAPKEQPPAKPVQKAEQPKQ